MQINKIFMPLLLLFGLGEPPIAQLVNFPLFNLQPANNKQKLLPGKLKENILFQLTEKIAIFQFTDNLQHDSKKNGNKIITSGRFIYFINSES